MANEKELTDKFKRILGGHGGLKDTLARIEKFNLDYEPPTPGDEINSKTTLSLRIVDARQKIQQLRQIGVNEQRINEVINKILERVRSEVLKILQTTKMSETERQIAQHLDNIERLLNFSYEERKNQVQARQMWAHEIKALEELSIAEEDLVKARERVLQILDRLVQAAEKLE